MTDTQQARPKPIVYFLCTGNSCRSQIAEGFGRHYGGDDFEIHSGGVEAHGLNPKAVETMKEAGIDISHHNSDVIDPDILNRAHYVITLCGDASDRCPLTPPHVTRLHWGFDDPAKATGTDEEIRQKFRDVRDEIGKRIKLFLDEHCCID